MHVEFVNFSKFVFLMVIGQNSLQICVRQLWWKLESDFMVCLGYSPSLGYYKKKSLSQNNLKKVAGADARRHHGVWTPGWCDYCVFNFVTDIDPFGSLFHCIVPYCRDEDLSEVKTVLTTIVCMVLSNEILALTRTVCISSLRVTRVGSDVIFCHVYFIIIAYD